MPMGWTLLPRLNLRADAACVEYNALYYKQCKGPAMSAAATSSSRTINVRLPAELYEQLEALAQATARTKSFVTLEALNSYLAAQTWQVRDIEAGLAQADRGDFASDEEVSAVFRRHGA